MIALAFSGGKDSWACLWLNKDKLKDLTVLWINTGKNYPEMLATIDRAKAICPNFVEIKVDRDGQNAVNGIPSDVVPVNWTAYGQMFTGEKSTKVQSYLQCCIENIGKNLHDYCKTFGFTHLIRGQRNDEAHKSISRHGDIVDGITYLHPIENWTKQEVLEFVAKHMDIPEHFRFMHSSMDCYDCTAYRAESKDRIEYAKLNHPMLHAQYAAREAALNAALSETLYAYSFLMVDYGGL